MENFVVRGRLEINNHDLGTNTDKLLVIDSNGIVKSLAGSYLSTNFYTKPEISDILGGTVSITGYNKTNWDTAYAWGDHSLAGYAATNHTHNYLSLAGGTLTGGLTASSFIKSGGTAAQFLKADGSVDNNTYLTSYTNTTYTSSNGILLTGTNFTPTYGTGANTIAQGNDSRINNGQTAFGWGNHASKYVLNTSGAQLDPNTQLQSSSYRFDPHINNPTNTHYSIFTYGNNGNVTAQLATRNVTAESYIRNYNTSWSSWRKIWDDVNLTNVSQLTNDSGYLTIESDTLDSVTNRGNTTTNPITVGDITGTSITFGTFGGGWNMTDSSWIRTTGGKSIYQNSGTLRTDGTLHVGPSGSKLNVPASGTPTIDSNTIYHAGNLTNVSQLTNDSGYLTSTTGDSAYVKKSGDTMTSGLNLISANYRDHIRINRGADGYYLTQSGTSALVEPYGSTSSFKIFGESLVVNTNGNTTASGSISANNFNGINRGINTVNNNLGDPTIEEFALVHGQMANKFRFRTANLQEESVDGITWTASTRATTTILADMMIGEGQGTSFQAIPAPVLGGQGHYRLTWDAPTYEFLNKLYIYCSTDGNTVNFKVEAFHNTNGWTEFTSSSISNWPGHVFIPHSRITFNPSNTSQHGKVRVTFSITNAAYANPFSLYQIEWFGGYPAGRRNVESYDRNKGVTFPNTITGTSLIKSGGTSTQFLKADGSVDSNTYLTSTTGDSTYVKKNGDTMTGQLNLNNTELVFSDFGSTNIDHIYHDETLNTFHFVSDGTLRMEGNSNLKAGSFIKSGGLSTQFLKADGSVDSNTYSTTSHTHAYLPLSGGTLTGSLSFTPTGPGPAVSTVFGANTTYKSYINLNAGPGSSDPGFIMHETSAGASNNGVLHLSPSDDNANGDYVTIHGTNDPETIKLHTSGFIETTGDILGATIKRIGGTATQFLKADGTVDSNTYLTSYTNTTYTSSNGILLTGTNFTPTYGTALNTIAQGNDSRINNGQTAFTWGNHAGLYSLTNHTHSTVTNSGAGSYLGGLTSGSISGIINSTGIADGNPTESWYHRIKMLHDNAAGYFTEIAVRMTGGNSMWYKRYDVGVDYGWTQVWDSGNLINISQLTNDAGYLTTFSETDTLQSITDRGATTSNKLNATGSSTSWGVSSGVNTGAFNAIMGTTSSATWLLSGTSAGVFRGGIQVLDGGGTTRYYTGSNYFQFSSNTLSSDSFNAVNINATSTLFAKTIQPYGSDGLGLYGDNNDGTGRGANVQIGGNGTPYVDVTIGDTATTLAGQFNVTNRSAASLGTATFNKIGDFKIIPNADSARFHQFLDTGYQFIQPNTLSKYTKIELAKIVLAGGSGGNHTLIIRQDGSNSPSYIDSSNTVVLSAGTADYTFSTGGVLSLPTGGGLVIGGKTADDVLLGDGTTTSLAGLGGGGPESDTLQTVTDRGAVTTTAITTPSVKSGTPSEGCEMKYNATSKTMDFIFS